MSMKSVSGVICLVKDLDEVVEFYNKLGFKFRNEKTAVEATAYLNWFWIEFLLADEAITESFQEDKSGERAKSWGSGQYIHISVEDIDEFYQELVDKGFVPLGEPKDYPWGRREFTLQDPNGYKLVFFSK